MAAALDIATCTSSAEAFKHPLMSVRHFQRQLNSTLEEKNARLRTLVGGSYRQLLTTADTIVEMRRDIEEVESDLGRVAEQCGKDAIMSKVSGLMELEKHERLALASENGLQRWGLGATARMKSMEGSIVAVGRLLKGKEGGPTRGARLVTAAMVWVLARLLLNNLMAELKMLAKPASMEALLEDSKKKISSLRRRLLRSVEQMVQRDYEDENRSELSNALCAYSLATSSSLKDVVRWFLKVRGEGIVLAFETEEGQSPTESVLKALSLYTRALLDVQLLAPKKLSETLKELKSKHLLKNEQLRELDSLRLDVSQRWLGDDILFFTPYIRHDDLDLPQAKEMLRSWSKQACEVLLEGLKNAIERIPDLKSVKELRTAILEKWISDSSRIKGVDTSVLLDGLRQACLDRMIAQVETRATKLHLVATEVEGTLAGWQPGVTDKLQNLWGDDILQMDIGNGASLFKQELLSRLHGRNDYLSRVIASYHSWRRLVDDVSEIISQIRDHKWDDDLEDLEDDLSLENRDAVLSKEDPDALQEHLDSSLLTAFEDLHTKIRGLLIGYKTHEKYGHFAIFILRVVRDVRNDLPSHTGLKSWGLDLVPGIHETIAELVAEDPVDRFAISAFSRKKVAGRALWEGSPELPTQPSPAAFRFMRNLVGSMTSIGSDLWSAAAVKTLKGHVLEQISSRWGEALEETAPGDDEKVAETNSEAGEVKEDEEKPNGVLVETTREVQLQAVFDILILRLCLSSAKLKQGKNLEALLESLHKRLDLEKSSKDRLENAAQEHWKKICLLFGLLG